MTASRKSVGISRRGLKRAIVGLLTLLVLIPAPAMALTFTGNWVATTSVSGGPTPPTPTFNDFTNNPSQVDDLIVNSGTYQGATQVASSTIELRRGISLSKTQTVEFEDQFVSQFKQAGTTVSVSVLSSSGQTVLTPISLSAQFTGPSTWELAYSAATTAKLKSGTYTLDVKVTYNTNNKIGGWKTISPNHFEFTGF
jgi:flagellar hook assembly protein FlgD